MHQSQTHSNATKDNIRVSETTPSTCSTTLTRTKLKSTAPRRSSDAVQIGTPQLPERTIKTAPKSRLVSFFVIVALFWVQFSSDLVLGACNGTKFGCCPDELTLARGPDFSGCGDPECAASRFGCCKDRRTIAFGPHYKGKLGVALYL